MFIVFDDVEYAELAFRNARDLVMYYRYQSQIIEETLRKNNKRKKLYYKTQKQFWHSFSWTKKHK